MLKKIYKVLLENWIVWLIGGILIFWGYSLDGWIKIGIGCLVFFLAVNAAIYKYKLYKRRENWFVQNEGEIIFFYPTKKQIQIRIQEKILPFFKKGILQAYYKGPMIVCNFENINFLVSRIEKVRPNNPSIIKIRNGEFEVIAELAELMNIEDENFNFDQIRNKIKEADV